MINSKQYVQGTAATWNPKAQNRSGGAAPSAHTQPDYAVWNALADYRIDRNWRLALNVNNLFDKWDNRTVGSSALGSFYGEPRNWELTPRGRF